MVTKSTTGTEQHRTNVMVLEHLKPRERLIWVGRERVRGLQFAAVIFVLPPLMVLAWYLLVRAPLISLLGIALYFAAFLPLYVLAVKARKNFVLALTDRRIMVIYPCRSIYWFWNDDLNAVYPNIGADGTGDVKFLFKKQVQPQMKMLAAHGQRDGTISAIGNAALAEFNFTGIEDAQILSQITLSRLKGTGEMRPAVSQK
jgi:hypothetical protein